MKPVKQVIVMRDQFPDGKGGFIRPRKGKMIAQACHASSMFLFQVALDGEPLTDVEKSWLRGSHTKVCVRCDSEEELIAIYDKAREQGLKAHLVTDEGRTEFGGVPTITCLAIGPALVSDIDQITGGLTLL